MKTSIIIVAGGSGTRMGADIPKQFLPLLGKPILMHTLQRFYEALPEAELIVVLPREQEVHWAALCEEHGFTIGHRVVSGGETRFHSVKNGLAECADAGYIGVHDGVRPLVSGELIRQAWEGAQNWGAVIPVVPVTDSLRMVEFCGECEDMSEVIGSRPVERRRMVAVQTPQFFRGAVLLKSYDQEYREGFTDDASVVEAAGNTVTLIPGDPANIKITTPTDLKIATVIARSS